MHKIIEGMVALAKEKGVSFYYNEAVKKIEISNGIAKAIVTENRKLSIDGIVAGADYHHIEQEIIAQPYRQYGKKYWESRTMAPSSLLFYLGLDTKVPEIKHHNLFFDKDFERHAEEIYTNPVWPTNPLFYLCCPSVTDHSIAPVGQENLFLLMPLAPGLNDSEAMREKYFDIMMGRIQKLIGFDLVPHIIYKRSYCVNDFVKDYNAFKGNAYGLANTLKQTAFLKPKIKNKKIKNLYFTGQLTTPGPGVPPSLISGQMVALELLKDIE
jgi:phytoene desaturase